MPRALRNLLRNKWARDLRTPKYHLRVKPNKKRKLKDKYID